MRACVCVRVCMRVRASVRVCVFVCMRVRARACGRACVCTCVCMCVSYRDLMYVRVLFLPASTSRLREESRAASKNHRSMHLNILLEFMKMFGRQVYVERYKEF